jgi:flagellar basal-body rod modification protein FlgD
MFLQMLTTQLKNQDPLNPMESTEYATQLATFSGVEQQVRTNELLETLQTARHPGLGQLSGWIGMQAAAEMPVAFSGAPVTVQTTPRPARIVWNWSCRRRRIGGAAASIPLSDAPFEWTGTTFGDETLPPGMYSLAVENWDGEDLIETRAASVRATVEEVQLNAGEVVLTMQGGVRVPADAVTGLRQPQG